MPDRYPRSIRISLDTYRVVPGSCPIFPTCSRCLSDACPKLTRCLPNMRPIVARNLPDVCPKVTRKLPESYPCQSSAAVERDSMARRRAIALLKKRLARLERRTSASKRRRAAARRGRWTRRRPLHRSSAPRATDRRVARATDVRKRTSHGPTGGARARTPDQYVCRRATVHGQ